MRVKHYSSCLVINYVIFATLSTVVSLNEMSRKMMAFLTYLTHEAGNDSCSSISISSLSDTVIGVSFEGFI